MPENQKEHERVIHYTVNDEHQKTEEERLTPVQILTNAHIDPQTNYLIEIKGKEQISFKDKPNEPIEMKNGMKFISQFIGPTPVS